MGLEVLLVSKHGSVWPTGREMDDSGRTRQIEREDEVVGSARMESCILQWSKDGETDGPMGRQTGKGDRMSLTSGEAASCTESDRGLMAEGGETGGGADEKIGAELGNDGEGPNIHLEDPVVNHLPEKAAEVFSPAMNVFPSPATCRDSEALWEMHSEKSPFLGPRGLTQDYNQDSYPYDWTEDTPRGKCKYTSLFYPFVLIVLYSPVFTCLRWARLFQQGWPKGGCVSYDISTPLSLPGVGGVCVPAI